MLLNLAVLCFVFVISHAQKYENVTLTKEVIDYFLAEHNKARNNVGAAPLIWDRSLCEYATGQAAKCSQSLNQGRYGENGLVSSPKQTNSLWLAEEAMKSFLSIKNPDLKDLSCYSTTCRTYAQIVWQQTKKVGCAIIHCEKTGAMIPENTVTCAYSPLYEA